MCIESSDRLNRIMSAYKDDRVFSIDLVGAVRALLTFIIYELRTNEGTRPGSPTGVVCKKDGRSWVDQARIFHKRSGRNSAATLRSTISRVRTFIIFFSGDCR